MDFWTKLIGGIGSSPATKQSTAKNPQQRLTLFKRYHSQLIQAWRDAPSISSNPSAAETIRNSLQRLTALLDEESRAPSPHPCISFASSSRIYTTVSRIAVVSYDDGIIRESISMFSSLIDSEEEEYLGSEGFARALMALFRIVAGGQKIMLGAETEGQLVELSFGIASNIRLQPELLPIWFTGLASHAQVDPSAEQELDERSKFAGVTHKEDFPLFYLLLDYVHHEGRVGDFARTGLLYIIESASISPELEQWIVESDLATLMASGLGALYSQLNRKFTISFSKDTTPAILALSDYTTSSKRDNDAVTAPEVQAHLDTFLSYLLFWQDVLEHCKSYDVRQTLLDHFHILFLQQLLYPSLLESSDVDGGSVAVFTYLRRVLESLQNPDLIHLVLHYLLALPDQFGTGAGRNPRSPTAEKRRQSLVLLSKVTEDQEEKPTPSLFNLVDLILTSLRSHNPRTVTATLKLLSSILKRHHQYAISTLLRVGPPPLGQSRRTFGAYEKEMDLLIKLASSVCNDSDLDESYQAHLLDSQDLIECHPCSAHLLDLEGGGEPTRMISPLLSQASGPRDPYPHVIRPDDPLLRSLLSLLENFLRNDVELNISLTEAIADLLSCGHTRLEGWFFVDASHYQFGMEEVDEESGDAESSRDMSESQIINEMSGSKLLNATRAARKKPVWSVDHASPVLSVLQDLLGQVDAYRKELPDLDTLIAARKQAFKVSEELTEALDSSSVPIAPSHPFEISTPMSSPQRSRGMDSIPSRLLNEDQSVSRSGSPRGRRGITNLYGLSPSVRPERSSQNGSGSPVKHQTRPISPSPLRETTPATVSRPAAISTNDTDLLKRKIGVPLAISNRLAEDILSNEGSSTVPSGSGGSETPNEGQFSPQISVSHLLTNIVILEEFILELAALIQTRAGLFDEIRFL